MTTPPSSDPAAGPPTPPPDDDPNQPPQPAEPPSSELVPPVSSSTLMMPGFAAPTPAGSASSIVVPPGDGTLLEFGTGTASADASAAASAPPASSEITGSAIDAALDPAPGTRPGATQATLQSAINTLRQPSGQRLEVGAEIARGGMGAILSVTDQHLRREVAMKVLLPAAARDADRLHRFIEEAQITGQLDHPNIVPVHDIGVMPDGRIYFTMKMVRGASMSRIVRLLRDGDAATVQRYTLGARLNAFRQVCQAVAFAHSRGVVHRDLKPENVMVGDYGEVLLMDWGLARVGLHAATAESARVVHTDRRDAASRGGDTQVASTLDGTVAGTPAYMAPEQAAGDIDQVDSRSDIWALGAILFEMLAWRPPFEGHTGYEIVHKVRTTTPVWPGERETDPPVPRELVAVVQQAMQREKSARYADAGQLIADIDAFLDGRTLAAATYTTRQVLTKWLRRHRAAVIPSAVGAVALLVVGAWFLLTTLQQNAEIARHAAHVEQQRDEIRRERDVADRAHEEAEAARDREADQRVAAERALADVWFERATRAASEARIDEALRDAGRALDAADHAGARALLAAHLPQLPIASCALRARPETLAVSPDGSRLALAMDNGHVSVVRLPSLGPEYDIEVSDAVQIAFSRDAEWLAIGCEDGAASVHDARTGERVCQLQGNDDLITGLAFTFDAEAVITIAFDGTMRLFSALDGTPLAKVTVEGSSSLYALAPAPWNGWVAVGDNRGHVFLFNATTLERELTIRVGDGTVAGIAVSWRRIAVSCRLGDSCRLRVFDTPDLDDVDTEPDEEFEPDFETDLQTPWMGSYLAQLMPPDVASGPMAYGLQLAHDAGDGLALIDLFGDSRPLRVFKPVGDLAIYAMSPDARLAIAAFRVDGAWMLQTHRAGSFFGPDHFTSGTGQVCSLAFDGTDSSLLMLRNSVEAGLCEGRIDCETGWVSPAGMPADSREWCLELYVSADGSRMLAVDHAGPSYVTDRRRTHDYRLTAPGKEQTDDDDDHPRTSAGALSADGYLAALGRPDGTIDFYDLHGDRCTATRRSGHAGKVHAIAISPDGRRAASVDAAGMLRVWDLTAAGAPTELAVRSLDAPLFCAAFSPDSAWLAIGGERPGIALFDMRGSDLPPPVSLDASAQRLLAMAFSPDSSLLIAGGYGGTLLVSDIAARSVIARIPVGDAISALAMRADGLLAVGTAHDDVIRLFRIAALTAPRDRAAQVCSPPADQRLAAATRARELYRAD
ncbi:MAG: protein kinase, partial [Planctomycetota bacterium]